MRTPLIAGLLFCSNVNAQTPTVSGDDMLCPDGTGTLTTQTYDTYQWLQKYYGSSVTNPIPGETNQTLVMNYYDYAASYMSVVTTLGGVTDTSAEFFVDGWVFGGAYVISDGDFTIGMSGEAILCPNATMTFELGNPYSTNITWYKDGDPIPGETSQILTVTESGTYYVEGAPAVCPDFIQGPGVSLEVEVLVFPHIESTTSGDFTTGTGGEFILCPEDTLYFHATNPYTENIIWYQDGNVITGENTQTLMVTEPGIYNVEGAPADCPLYIETLQEDLVVEQLSFPALAVAVSGDNTIGPDGEYIICEATDEVIITLNAPYTTTISWYQDSNVLTGETTQTLTTTDVGFYLVNAAPAECPNYIQALSDTIFVENCGLGFEENESDVSVIVYPNPARAQVTVQIAADRIGSTYELLDAAGRLVQHGQLLDVTNTLETSALESGIYMLRVNGKSTSLVAIEN